MLHNLICKMPRHPMFGRYLSTVGFPPAQIVYNHWRHWYQPSHLWWTQPPHWQHPSSSFSTVRHLSNRPPRPPDPYNWSSWGRSEVLPHIQPRQGVHFSAFLMDRSDREPPPKRRKSADGRPGGERSQRSPECIPPNGSRSPKGSPEWLQSVTGGTVPPGKFPSSPERTAARPELKRQWEDLSQLCNAASAKEGKQKLPFDFSVMSYNILSQDLLCDNTYLYRHCNPPVLDWHHRFSNIIKELEQHSADIMCLQEVQEDHYQQQIKPSLESLGYHCEYKRRTGLKPDGCAVVFKRERFSLVSCHPVEYFRRGIPLLDRDNVGLIVLLRPVDPHSSLTNVCVANTHLLYNPRRGDIKLAQLAMLLAEITRVAQLADSSVCPVLLCGDFNSIPWSPLYRFIRDSRLDYDGITIGKVSGQEENPRGQRVLTVPIWPKSLGISQQCQYESQTTDSDSKDLEQTELDGFTEPSIEHGLKLTSAYSHYLKESGQSEITTCHSRTAITVDYIFYSAAQGDVMAQAECSVPPEKGLQLLGRLALVGKDELNEVNGLPNQNNSSDHLPLLTRFRLNP
ncbi:protein angel homolog 2 isoform X2 [Pimephales promelas]|uniref:protein angel homolog 2 isoform X2 n=1 Tax=Pimephales promelas TaxID=90988 RepID=UPI0019558B43|nr:protein angel homolog 2 isoform X2 [Pimephales promelas]KAG1963535.1 protein angel [Pimephales promelas]